MINSALLINFSFLGLWKSSPFPALFFLVYNSLKSGADQNVLLILKLTHPLFVVGLCIHSRSHYLRLVIFLSHFLSSELFPECISTQRTDSWLILSVMQTLLSATNMLQIINIPDFLIKNEELIWWTPSLVYVTMLMVLWSIMKD